MLMCVSADFKLLHHNKHNYIQRIHSRNNTCCTESNTSQPEEKKLSVAADLTLSETKTEMDRCPNRRQPFCLRAWESERDGGKEGSLRSRCDSNKKKGENTERIVKQRCSQQHAVSSSCRQTLVQPPVIRLGWKVAHSGSLGEMPHMEPVVEVS